VTQIVYLAGIDNSGPQHWQSLWREQHGGVWVEHADWQHPDRDLWVADLDATLRGLSSEKLIVAHSLGCLLLAEWAQDHADAGLGGAFLVAPPDVEAPSFPSHATGFRTVFELALPCPAAVVASDDDAYATLDYARRLTAHWRARLIEVGRKGHINAASGLGAWDEGWQHLQAFASEIERSRQNAR
jgi:predicted alpha/beta hydrolase family esterase